MMKSNTPYHMVTSSPWPLLTALSTMNMLIKITVKMNFNNNYSLIMPTLTLLLCVCLWFRDIIRESLYQGYHTNTMMKNLKMGMILFITSEALLFASLFWMLLHMSMAPSIEFNNTWPPKNLLVFNPLSIPLINTVILLTSGFFITWSHYSIINNSLENCKNALLTSIICGVMFMIIQMFEYKSAHFTITDSVYGSAFFMITGFHGSHVLLGCLLLSTTLMRINNSHMSSNHHFLFEAAAWYWHFVDAIWLFVYILLYF